jgi:3',5'-cyclic AMP phosphodiesterase CpdA
MRKLCLCAVLMALLVWAQGFNAERPALARTEPAWHSNTEFAPAPGIEDSFTFAVVGDSREGSFFEGLRYTIVNRTRELIIDKIAESNPTFVVNTGDLVKKSAENKDWQEFEKLNQVLEDRKIPYYPVLGNHEYRGRETEAIADYFDHFPALNKQLWYTLTYANSGLIMLDSNFDKLSKEEIVRQNQWLGDTLRKYQDDRNISFVFVFFHHPPFTNSMHHKPDKQAQNNFVPLLDKFSKVKFVFNGHVHSYERFRINGINYVVTGGGGAPLVALRPAGQSRYKDEYDTTGEKPRGTHFCLVTAGKDYIELKTLHLDPAKLTWSEGDGYRVDYGQSENENSGRPPVG